MSVALRVMREPSDMGRTPGALYINDFWVCWTLEPAIRERPRGLMTDDIAWVKSWKVAGHTAIPAGRYPVVWEFSARFRMMLPELKDVPGFSETKFHAGNTEGDTEGCILVGTGRSTRGISGSKLALGNVIALLKSFDGTPMFVDVENPPGRHLAPHTVTGERRA